MLPPLNDIHKLPMDSHNRAERIFPYLLTENLPQVDLGKHTTSPAFAEPPEPFTERYPWLLPTVVSLAALVIAVFLTSLLRQVCRILPAACPDQLIARTWRGFAQG